MTQMDRNLIRAVVVTNPRTRLAETLRPGEPVPGWAAELITNPNAWGPEHSTHVHAEFDKAGSLPPAQVATGPAQEEVVAVTETTDEVDDGVLEEPPRAGRGSSLQAWQDYADALGIEYANDATRDDIIAAVDTARS